MKHKPFDLNLPDWGPYGKQFVGLSHVADAEAGDRWDCFVMPGYHRRAVIGAYAVRENRWHHWKTAPDLSSYTLRYELEWKDQVYVDATFSGKGEGRFIEVECVNHTDLPQNLDVHLAATLTRNPLRPATVKLPEGGRWIGALDYADIHLSGAEFRKQQTIDAKQPGEWHQPGSVGGTTVGAIQFFNQTGDRLEYEVSIEHTIEEAILLLRYHRWTDSACQLHWHGFGQDQDLDMICDGTPMSQMRIPLGKVSAGTHRFSVELTAGSALILEGFALLPEALADDFEVVPAETGSAADWVKDGQSVCLGYDGFRQRYVMTALDDFPTRVRRVSGEDVAAIVCEQANDSVHDQWSGIGDRETLLLTCGPVMLAPGESRTLRFQVGLEGAVIEPVAPFSGNCPPDSPYAFGMERLAATTLANVVYPIRHREGYVRHNTPGRWWDCLYTWDSGMLGLGLAALDLERAKGCLDQYLLPEDDPYAAFIEHGTPLPIQAELAREIWDQTQDRDWLAEVFPKLRNFYEWLAGRTRGSTTDRFQTGLLQTWDYNYNSGGWDDYPPQHALVQDPARRRRIAPMVTTSYAIRFARHMQLFAGALGETAEPYDADLTRWTAALESAWDPDSGYYGYLEHDAEGQPAGVYRHESGENFNRGSDGIIPLVTGVLPESRRDALLEKLFDPSELWTEWGMTTVSRSAAYYSDAGYWNGAVWMPHNYSIWKALREQGLDAQARKLAEAVLGGWERECRASYHCFELFRANTGRGSGWHQFGGLSAPLLAIHRSEFGSTLINPIALNRKGLRVR